MVGRSSLLALVSGMVLAGCAWLPFGEPACPDITDTSAWINRMPGPGQSGGKLHVVVRLADDQSWKLSPVPTEEEGLLVLSLSEGGPSVPGTAAYQQSRKPLPQRVKIECHGKAVAFIDKITVAY
ncbi:MAG: hypothetical protein R3265_08390 [Hyphomonas sp.]|nr:hypothetical protein [Hyphomonas sp.]